MTSAGGELCATANAIGGCVVTDIPNPPTAEHPFVTAVRSAMRQLREDRYQDQLDVLLLGGTVPAVPIPQPDPDCSDCWGYGRVCPCHGVVAAHCGVAVDAWRKAHLSAANTERCDCVKRQGTRPRTVSHAYRITNAGLAVHRQEATNP